MVTPVREGESMLNIVMLDTYPYKKESFTFLEEFGQVQLFDHTNLSDIIPRIKDANLVLTNKTPLLEEHFKHASKLKYIGVIVTGYNVVDVVKAREYNITVTNVPAYGTNSVAQHTFAILLELVNRIATADKFVKNDGWANEKKWCVLNNSWNELNGKTLGIIGYGAIGKKVSAIANAFGMKVVVNTRTQPSKHEPVEFVDFKELLKQSDIISLHCPLTPETLNLIGRDELALMKKTAILINVSRGPLIDENALFDALNNGYISGAGLDVLSQEPPLLNNRLCMLNNCIITPHIAWSSNEAMDKILEVTKSNIVGYLNSTLQNVVNL
jgi:glycerate dehydrogenase